MSPFDQAFAEHAAASLLDHFGEEVTYTPTGGEAAAVTGVVGRGESRDDPHDRGRRRRKTWELIVPTTAEAAAGTTSGNYVADPHQAATVTIDDEEFHVSRVLSGGPLATLEITNAAAREVSRPGMRQ